jgi:hypothetical protein
LLYKYEEIIVKLMATKLERRKHPRYSIKNGAYATISPNSAKIGQIIDMSMAGLAFKYSDTIFVKTEKSSHETLLLSSVGCYVGDLDFKTVADNEMPDSEIPGASSGGRKIRIRRVKFIDLKLKQLSDLDYYIEKNALQA